MSRLAMFDGTGREVGSIVHTRGSTPHAVSAGAVVMGGASPAPFSPTGTLAVYDAARSLYLWDAARNRPRQYDTRDDARAAITRARLVEVAGPDEATCSRAAFVTAYPEHLR